MSDQILNGKQEHCIDDYSGKVISKIDMPICTSESMIIYFEDDSILEIIPMGSDRAWINTDGHAV